MMSKCAEWQQRKAYKITHSGSTLPSDNTLPCKAVIQKERDLLKTVTSELSTLFYFHVDHLFA